MQLDSRPLLSQEVINHSHQSLLPTVNNSTTALTPIEVSDTSQTTAAETDCPSQNKTTWGVFATTFVTIFLAEIGDKTQLSTLLMSAESHAPWIVFIGSAIALVSTSLLGVLLGSWMATKLSPRTINKSAGVMLLFISVMLLWDLWS